MSSDRTESGLRARFGNDKGDVRVPGAGTMGMYLLLASLGMLFGASVVGYLLIRFGRFGDQPWPPPGFPPLPWTLWISTGVILLTSVAIQWAVNGIRRDNQGTLKAGLAATLGLGLLFLALQGWNWWDIWRQLLPEQRHGGSYIMLFYALTFLHAAHVVGGLIPLGIVMALAHDGERYSKSYHPGVRYCAIYWHFLDAVWMVLFTVLYLI